MRWLVLTHLLVLASVWAAPAQSATVRVWERVEFTLEAQSRRDNPYTDVEVWVDLEGPGFAKRRYGFWDGGRAFFLPGKVPGYEDVYPDVDRLNPEYFRYLDRKIDYLNQQGFVVFLEVARRDCSSAWGEFYAWPESYSRYVQYVWSRYQANICIYSPIHYDWVDMAMTERQFSDAANRIVERYGPPPFGTLVSCNSSLSSQANFGRFPDNEWLTLQQIGNWREHDHYWYLTEIFHTDPPRRAGSIRARARGRRPGPPAC